MSESELKAVWIALADIQKRLNMIDEWRRDMLNHLGDSRMRVAKLESQAFHFPTQLPTESVDK